MAYSTRCALCIAHSKGHWLSGSLLWDSKSISKFLGGGPNFHAFNESRQPSIIIASSGDVIHPQLWESGSGYETTPPPPPFSENTHAPRAMRTY